MQSLSTITGKPTDQDQFGPRKELLRDIFEMGVDMIPVYGDLQQAYDVYKGEVTPTSNVLFSKEEDQRDPQKLGPIMRVLLGVAAVAPFVPTKIFTSAAKAPKSAILKAKGMIDAGASPKDIRLQTNIFKNPYDLKPRYEISDLESKFTTDWDKLIHGKIFDSIGEYKLGDVFEHKELFDIYPELKDLKVEKKQHLGIGIQGSYNPDTKTIRIQPGIDHPRETLLHEIQHWVQYKENFPTGGNESSVQVINNLDKLKKRYIREIGDIRKTAKGVLDWDASYDIKNLTHKFDKVQELEQIVPEIKDIQKNITSLKKEQDKILKKIGQQFEKIDDLIKAQFDKWTDINKQAKEAEGKLNTGDLSGKYEAKTKKIIAWHDEQKNKIQDNIKKLNAKREELYADRRGNTNLFDGMVREQEEDLTKIMQPYETLKYDTYRAITGEIESREVSKRADIFPEQERPFKDADVKPDESILVKNAPSKMVSSHGVDRIDSTIKKYLNYFTKNRPDSPPVEGIVFRTMKIDELNNIKQGGKSGNFWSSDPTEYGRHAIGRLGKEEVDRVLVAAKSSGINRYVRGLKGKHFQELESKVIDEIIGIYKWDGRELKRSK